MWVGEATENSVYFINAEAAYSSHLKTSSAHIQKWAKLSSSNSVRSLSIIIILFTFDWFGSKSFGIFGLFGLGYSCFCSISGDP